MSNASPPLEITCRDVQAKLASGAAFLFLDCREPNEAEVAAIAGTKLIPMSQIAERASELEPHRDQEIVVHCHHGGRSLRVATWLRNQGFSRASSMAGGIDQWAVEIDPTLARY